MFIGHFAAAFAAKRVAPQTSLGTLALAAQFIDLVWPTLLLLGIERVVINPALTGAPLEFVHYPVSHSLFAVAGWGLLVGAACFVATRQARAAIVVGLLVLSHWALDALVHRPDLPLVLDGGPVVGLALWNWPLLELALELVLFGAGFALYRSTPAGQAAGAGPWFLAVVLVAIQVGNAFGPPPPSVEAIAWVGQSQWLLVAAAYWADRPRRSRRGAAAFGGRLPRSVE
jgi:hypothetical protein